MKKSVFIIALAVAATACTNPQNKQDTEETIVEQNGGTTEQIADLSGKEWKLVTLNGKAIVLDSEFPAEPHLIFDQAANRVTGNAGCNGFGGNLELSENDGIAISDIISTQMACPNLEIEQQFIEALKNAKHYHVHSNILSLHGEGHSDLATLELK